MSKKAFCPQHFPPILPLISATDENFNKTEQRRYVAELTSMTRRHRGMIVLTKSGFMGRVYSRQGRINGKVAVYVDGQKKAVLCKPEGLIVKGFFD